MVFCRHCSVFLVLSILSLFVVVLALLTFIIIKLWLQNCHQLAHKKSKSSQLEKSIGFFHPYCNAGGGGERVLWCAIRAIQNEYPSIRCIVYTGDKNVTSEEILDNVARNFNIFLSKKVEFVFLNTRHLVEDKKYPYFTLLGQSIGSMLLGLEAIFKFVPTIYIDTMGYAFTLPLFKYLGNCSVVCYVHYPTISVEMLDQVVRRETRYNNPSYITKNIVLTKAKLVYYQIFAKLYSLCGQCADVVMVNSSWTEGHINQLWKRYNRTFKIYPPCDVSTFEKLTPKPSIDKQITIISISQFRPEKNHETQIRAFKELLNLLPVEKRDMLEFIIVGSCRNEDDEKRVKALQEITRSLDCEKFIKFKLNITFEILQKHLQDAVIGLHTMKNEHFGIGVVECMAAGVVIVAHDSGGPKMDIVTEYDSKPTGFLANSVEEYAQKMYNIISMSPEKISEIQKNAKKSVQRFSESKFAFKFLNAVQPVFKIHRLTPLS